MSLSNHTYQARATASAERLKGLLPMLLVLCVVGGVFGYFVGGFVGEIVFPYWTFTGQTETGILYGAQSSNPDIDPSTYSVSKGIFLAVFSLFGMIFWPAVFCVTYYLRWRKQERVEAALIADQDTQVRAQREKNIERRIEEAKAAGAFDKWGTEK